MNLAELLFGDDTGADDDVVIYVNELRVTRGQLRDAATRLAVVLRAAGVEPGDAVGVMLPNGAAAVAALFGVWRTRAVHVPLNPRATGAEIGRVMDALDPTVLITTTDHDARTGDGRGLVVAGADAPIGWELARPVTPRASRRYGDRIALVQSTSGTTGPPKPVLIEHDTVVELMDNVLRKIRGGGPEGRGHAPPNLIPLSLSLWAGIYNVLFAFRVGAPLVLMSEFEPRQFARLVREHAISSVVLPPAAMAMLCDTDDVTDLSPLRFVRSITAPLSPFQARRFVERFGVAVLNCYGQTEIGGEIIGWNASDWRTFGDTKLGAVGRPHEGVEVRVLDEAGADVIDDVVGELCVRTPAVTAGYADGRDLSDRLTPDGWFRTGDLGRVDADGFVWIEGRVSGMVNRGGLKVFPAEVEEVIRAVPGVHDVAVVGAPDDRLGEIPWAFVVADHELDVAALETECRAHLAPYKVPARFMRVEELPRNDVGKVVTHQLLERSA
ncbi:MAG: acyl--CoA ligase [Actinobacteria bacterium]|nr:MAG: acyl--CoA ligase [Actinomycetota bacterium]